MKRFNSLFLVAVVLIAACSSKKTYTHVLSGKITVADSVDASKDYSGIGYLVIKRDSTQKADTVFFAGAFHRRKRVFATDQFVQQRLRHEVRVDIDIQLRFS